MIRLSRITTFSSYTCPGASKMKWFFVKPYVRADPTSLIHYPETSNVDKRKIDWMYDKPYDRSEVISVYGPNTIELRNLPMGRTPEYLQERLRRFFSKFGVVSFCRCKPHDLDPYQCNGTGYVTFRSKKASIEAASANLVFPFTLHSKKIAIRHLDTDKTNDPDYLYKNQHYNKQILAISKDLYTKICKTGICNLSKISHGIYERNFYTGKFHKAGLSVFMRFGNWVGFLNFEPFKELFKVEDGNVTLRLTGDEKMERVMKRAEIMLGRMLEETVTKDWREGKPKLIEQAQKEVDALYYMQPLPEQLQLLSRSHNMYRLHDERHLLKISIKQKRNEARRLYRSMKRAQIEQ
ncbi:hypothetical protein MACJ_002221 [Theileria orientalis]|uniref:RRM domain-containing protein n=1 Tax=Theileria orientalis TaxID=68886 RepID=A0A976M5N7_THEOR|nr:hypothetical protein MACJ_002221 [Theileria orientalis]